MIRPGPEKHGVWPNLSLDNALLILGVSLGDFASQLDDYMRYYRGERIKRSLGWMSPSQYRKSLGLAA